LIWWDLMKNKTRDLATVFSDAYSLSAPVLLAQQHEFLLKALEKHFLDISSGTLVVIGPGGRALPYSLEYEDGFLGDSNRDRVKDILKGGRAVFVDYVREEEKGGLEQEIKTFTKLGFFDKGYFALGPRLGEFIQTSGPGPGTFSFLLNNARDPLRIENEFADAIDATLSLHHVCVNRQAMGNIFKELFRVLKPGGMLHLGEGNIDMNYTEDKIIRIATDISEILKKDIALTDNREKGSGYVVHAFFESGKSYSALPVIESMPPNNYANMTITEEGTVLLTANRPNEIVLRPKQINDLSAKLTERGYKQMLVFGDSLFLPLIDPKMKSDSENMIKPVDAYYDAVKGVVFRGLHEQNKKLYNAISEGIEFERGNAKRGIVEYFMGKRKIISALKHAGFVDIDSTKSDIVPLYNLTAYKPKA